MKFNEEKFEAILKKIPEKLKHLDFHKLYLYSKFWLSFYTVAKYERGSWTEKLFEKEEAELALKHVRRCYEGANQLKNYMEHSW